MVVVMWLFSSRLILSVMFSGLPILVIFHACIRVWYKVNSLYCMVLYFTALCCTVLYPTVLYCIVQSTLENYQNENNTQGKCFNKFKKKLAFDQKGGGVGARTNLLILLFLFF